MEALLFAACMTVLCGASGLVYWAAVLRTTRPHPTPDPTPTKGIR